MKRTMRFCGVPALAFALAAAALLSSVCATQTFGGGYNGESGDGYRSETNVRDPDPVPFNDMGVMRAVGQNNAIDTPLLEQLKNFSCRTAVLALGDGTENRNYAPVSLFYAAALASQGAEGNTRAQLLGALGIPETERAKLAENCGRLYRQMYRENEYARLKLVNTAWLSEGDPLTAGFLRAAEGQYYTSVVRMDFGDPNAPEIMRRWTADRTGGGILADVPLNAGETLRLEHAVYYHDQWVNGFDAAGNRDGVFFGAADTACTYMTGRKRSSYVKGQGYTRASLSLMNNGYVVFVLPDEGVSLSALLASQQQVRALLDQTGEMYGWVSWEVPRFQISAATDQSSALRALGVTDAFEAGRADFSAAVPEPAALGDVSQKTAVPEPAALGSVSQKTAVPEPVTLGSVIQKTRVCVGENGVSTDLGQAWIEPGIGRMEIASGPAFAHEAEQDVRMHLNRPFFYAVMVAPGVPLYMGVCAVPAL